jgi:hypothetical protein
MGFGTKHSDFTLGHMADALAADKREIARNVVESQRLSTLIDYE